MAPPDMPEKDPYELLGVSVEASDAEIKKAYRQRSLKVHPDRNKAPEAATLFHELTLAQEFLLDPSRRSVFDASIQARRARAAQMEKVSSKRRKFQEDLEAAELTANKKRKQDDQEERRRRYEEERVKEEGRKLREAKQAQMEEEESKREEAAKRKQALGAHDLTLMLRLPNPPPTSDHLLSILERFGPLEPSSLLIRPPKAPATPSKKSSKTKGGTAVVQYLTKSGALNAVAGSGRKELGLEGITIGWVGGQEPAWLQADLSAATAPQPSSLPAFTVPQVDSLNFEDSVLERMRQMERKRMADQIRAEEGE